MLFGLPSSSKISNKYRPKGSTFVKIIFPFWIKTVCPGTKSKKPSPPVWGSLLKFNLSKWNNLIKGVSTISESSVGSIGVLLLNVGNVVPSTGFI